MIDIVDIVVDLETLSLSRPDAHILSIGAVAFDRRERSIMSEFEVNTPGVQFTANSRPRKICEDTVRWWLEQSWNASDRILSVNQGDTAQGGFSEFRAWIAGIAALGSINIWGYGAEFDISILEDALQHNTFGDTPWSHRDVRCARTVCALAGVSMHDHLRDGDILHHALSDARMEARALMEAMDRLGIK